MVSSFILFLCTVCLSVCVCVILCVSVFICVAQKNPQHIPVHICLSPLFAALSGHDLLRTHTTASTIGQDHKSEALSSLAAKKTQGCFSPTKRAINSVSQGVTHLSSSPHGKNSLHKPTCHSVSVLAAESVWVWPQYTYLSVSACIYSTLQARRHQAHCQEYTVRKIFLQPLLTSITTNHSTSWSLNMAICIDFHTVSQMHQQTSSSPPTTSPSGRDF